MYDVNVQQFLISIIMSYSKQDNDNNPTSVNEFIMFCLTHYSATSQNS